jgi:hypothetical protein
MIEESIMDDPASSSASGNSYADLGQSNLTTSGVSGKVPQKMIRRGPKRKRLKMSADTKHHVKSLMKRGHISSKAASFNGVKP